VVKEGLEVVAIEEEDGEDLREEDGEDLREEDGEGGERTTIIGRRRRRSAWRDLLYNLQEEEGRRL
jgi:hypothetical protein